MAVIVVVVVVVLIIRYRLEVGSGGVEQKWMCIMYTDPLYMVLDLST